MSNKIKWLLIVPVLVCWLGSANATPIIVWNQSPSAIGGTMTNSAFTNNMEDQNFSDLVRFDTDIWLTGMDIYMDFREGAVGDAATIRVRTGSHVGSLFEFNETVSLIDTSGTTNTIPALRRVHVDFTNPVSLLAGVDYWIGMSGTDDQLFQAGIKGGSGPLLDNRVAMYDGTVFGFFPSDVGDQAFRLWGEVSTNVPEPPLFSLFGIGLAVLGWSRRRSARILSLE